VSFVSNLLDFGILYSGVTKRSENLLREAYRDNGNSFTAIVHKTLLSKVSLMSITSDAVNILNKDLENTISQRSRGGLLDIIRHQLTLAMTGAIYGPNNPYKDSSVEAVWW
jgi:hypothetical protein